MILLQYVLIMLIQFCRSWHRYSIAVPAFSQVMVENIFKERAGQCGRRCVLERREIHELVQNQVAELGQDFHNQGEIQV